MALIHWSDRFSVNVAEIDAQHQQLVQMLNELHEALGAGHGRDVMGGLLDGLVSYAGTHFATEERYFAEHGYPEAEEHVKEHARFAAKVGVFRTQFDGGKAVVSIEVMDFLMEWLTQHIEGWDKKYGPFLNDRGVT